jgi:hypothetical protein
MIEQFTTLAIVHVPERKRSFVNFEAVLHRAGAAVVAAGGLTEFLRPHRAILSTPKAALRPVNVLV